MTQSDGDDTILNVRIPSSLASRLDEVYQKRGFKNKSEFVRTAIRDAINPPQELTDQALQDIEESREQAKENKTTSLSDLISNSEKSTEVDPSKNNTFAIAEEGSFGELQELFSKQSSTDEPELDVLAIGCGGAGNNIIHRLTNLGFGNIRTLAINTDRRHLDRVEADTKLLIGKSLTDGLGAGGNTDVGERAAKNAEESILEVISNADIVFVTEGLGGGTGTGAAPVVAELASEAGAVSIGLATTPFNVERERLNNAKEGIDKLRSKCDSVMIFDNNLLIEYAANLPLSKAFSLMDQIIAESMVSLVGTFSKNALVDIDFADFSTVVRDGGVGGILVGEGNIDELDTVVQDTLEHPLVNADISTASRGLVQITGPEGLTVSDAEELVESVFERISPDTSLIWGAQTNEKLSGTVRVMVLLTGLEYQTEVVADHTTGIKSSEDVELLSTKFKSSSDNEQPRVYS